MENERRKRFVFVLKGAGLSLLIMTVLGTAFIGWYGAHLTDSEINGYEGLYYAAKLLLTGETVMRYAEEPPTFFMFSRGRDTTEDWRALGVEWKGRMGSMGTATLDGKLCYTYHSSFTSYCGRIVFERMPSEEEKKVVINDVRDLCCGRYGCEGPVELADSFDELNITLDERSDMALTLEELYGVAIPDEELDGFVTLEDMVGYIEDRL